MKVLVAVIAMMVALGSGAAAGPNQEKADALFKKGKALLGQQKYPEACAAFVESHKLDPATGTVLNLALCYEGWGKVASAQKAYLEAEKLAAIKGDQTRSAAARQRADALTSRIPKLLFTGLPETLPPDLVVTLDNEPIGLDALKVGVSTDPGKHVVVYTVEGAKKSIRLEVGESTSKEVKLDLPAPKVVEPPNNGIGNGSGGGVGGGIGDKVEANPGRSRRILGLVTAGVGVATFGVGSYLALAARSDYKSAFSAHCDDTGCDDIGYDETHDARRRANIATIVVGAGVAIAATGVILYLTAPKAKRPREDDQVWIRPVLTDGGGAVVVGGRL